jgi:hypothetical protein
MTKSTNIKLILVVATAIGVFCWVSVRPYVDRKQCNEVAVKQVKNLGSPADDRLFNIYGRNYTLCVNAKGLAE